MEIFGNQLVEVLETYISQKNGNSETNECTKIGKNVFKNVPKNVKL